MKFVPAVARLFCLALPESFLTMFEQNKGDLCTSARKDMEKEGRENKVEARHVLLAKIAAIDMSHVTSILQFGHSKCLFQYFSLTRLVCKRKCKRSDKAWS